jgi:hypothetical protein
MIQRSILVGLCLTLSLVFGTAHAFRNSCYYLQVSQSPATATDSDRTKLLSEIQIYAQKLQKNTLDPNIDARRLILASDWYGQEKNGTNEPWLVYSESTLQQWLRGAEFVQKNFATMRFVSSELKQIHEQVMKGSFFKGYEQRRIRFALQSGVIAQSEGTSMLDAIARGERINFSKVDHNSLAVRFREHALDDDLTQGRPLLMRPGELTETGLAELERSDLVKVARVQNDHETQIFLEFPRSSSVEPLVEIELRKLRTVLQSRQTSPEKFRELAVIYRNLLLIHPFLNGNGRAIRLFMDSVYLKMGLAPPIHSFDQEFTMTRPEIEGRLMLGMAQYLQYRGIAP